MFLSNINLKFGMILRKNKKEETTELINTNGADIENGLENNNFYELEVYSIKSKIMKFLLEQADNIVSCFIGLIIFLFIFFYLYLKTDN